MTISNGSAAPSAATRGVLSTECAKSIEGFVGASTKADRAKTKAADLLHSGGTQSPWLFAPKKGEDESPITIGGQITTRGEFHTEVRAHIVLGFTTTIQKLLAAPVKSLTDEQKSSRRYWQQQISSRQKDLRKAVERLEAKENGEDGSPAPQMAKSPSTRISEYVCNAIKVAQKDESPTYNATELIKSLKAALATANINLVDSE